MSTEGAHPKLLKSSAVIRLFDSNLFSDRKPGHNYKGDIIMAKKEMKLEESFEKLNQILQDLEKSDISLEDSFTLYQEGMKLLKTCNDSIDKVEKELIVLSENGEANEL